MTVKTEDDIQIKVYANEHPEGFIIGVPKYIPTTHIKTDKLQLRTFDGKEYNRFNIRAIGKPEMKEYFEGMKKHYPDYFLESKEKDTWYMGTPKSKVIEYPDSKKGVTDLMQKDDSELDEYLKLTKSFIKFFEQAGIPAEAFGLTNSTLLGNYTYGRSDIDTLIFGKENYWKAMKFLETAEHELLRWRTKKEWQQHFVDYYPGMDITEEEYVKHQSRKRADGLWGGTVFSVFCASEPEDEKEKFDDTTSKHLGLVKIEATIKDDYNCCVRPGHYELEHVKVIEGLEGENSGTEVKPTRIFFYTRNFVEQAKKGEQIICSGMLEQVKNKETGEERQQITTGLFESYDKWRGKEVLKVKWE